MVTFISSPISSRHPRPNAEVMMCQVIQRATSLSLLSACTRALGRFQTARWSLSNQKAHIIILSRLLSSNPVAGHSDTLYWSLLLMCKCKGSRCTQSVLKLGLSHVMRQSVVGVCDQVRLKPTCLATEAG